MHRVVAASKAPAVAPARRRSRTMTASTASSSPTSRRNPAARAATLPPSNVSGGSELASLALTSTVVSNSVVFEDAAPGSVATAAAVTSRTLSKVLRDPVGMAFYEPALVSALSSPNSRSLDKAMVNVGAMLVDHVQGRVSTEVDARLASDADAIVAQVEHLAGLYEEAGVGSDRLLYRIPATWAGIRAAQRLEQSGKRTLLTLVCSLAQCVACAEAGVSVIQVNVGRVRDWYSRNPNAIRDPRGPREDAGLVSGADPGLALVRRCYNYIHKVSGARPACDDGKDRRKHPRSERTR